MGNAMKFHAVPMSTPTQTEVSPKEIRVVFRFDDPSAKSSTEIESRLIESFRQNHMTCTWAIIPFVTAESAEDATTQPFLPLPREKAQLFAEAAHSGVLEIALHGYSHQNNGLNGQYAEFAALPYEEQLSRIERGKQFLEAQLGVEVAIFVPPWNNYDANTIKALEVKQFKYLSASVWGPSDSSFLAFLPCTIGSPTKIKEAVAAARKSSDPAPIIVVLFHPYDFYEYKTRRRRGVLNVDQLADALQCLARQPDVHVVPMSGVSEASSRRYANNRRLVNLNSKLPSFLRHEPDLMYFSETFASRQGLRLLICLFALYAALLLLVAGVCFLSIGMVLQKPSLALGLLLLSGPLVLLLGVARPFYGLGRGSRGLISVVAVLGYCVGTWAAALFYCR
jgi:hypothetical protein